VQLYRSKAASGGLLEFPTYQTVGATGHLVAVHAHKKKPYLSLVVSTRSLVLLALPLEVAVLHEQLVLHQPAATGLGDSAACVASPVEGG